MNTCVTLRILKMDNSFFLFMKTITMTIWRKRVSSQFKEELTAGEDTKQEIVDYLAPEGMGSKRCCSIVLKKKKLIYKIYSLLGTDKGAVFLWMAILGAILRRGIA